MNKVERPEIGDYVLVTKYSDKDPNDPWFVSLISAILETKDGLEYQVEGSFRWWDHVWRISAEEGKEWLDNSIKE